MYVTADGTQLSLSGATNNWTVTKDASGHIQTGTTGNDVFYSSYGDTDTGGLGDDIYYIWNVNNTIVENAGEGVDTVYAYVYAPYTLAANVENLILAGDGATSGTGNALDNIVMAGTVGAMLDGAGGNDVLVGGSGYDTFRIEAGNGSDAIEQFDVSEDQVRLEGYDVTSFKALSALMAQSGSDVQINLPNGEVLILRDTSLSSLSAENFILANTSANATVSGDATSHAATGALSTLAGAGQAATANGWFALNNAWGAGGLAEGRDYSISSSYHAQDLTDGTTFTWSFPTAATSLNGGASIKAFPELIFGSSPYSGAADAGDTMQMFPVQVSTISAFTATHDITFTGDTRGYDVAYDIWLTNTPTGGAETISNEVMIWVHQGDFAAYGNKIGIYNDGDFSAGIYYNAASHYTAIVANSDTPTATIDVADILKDLESLGIVSGSEYVRDVELGAEVASGSGSLTINALDLSVQTIASDGSTVTKTVDGAGATETQNDPLTFYGTAAADTLTGNARDNMLYGYAGNDILDGGAGADTMTGGDGNDTYYVDNAGDQVIEAANGGVDYVHSTISYTLPTNVEHLILEGTGNINGTGNAANNAMIGTSGDNILNGMGGADVMAGGLGNDTYYVDNAGDQVIEAANGGVDYVHSTISYTLPTNVEHLILEGTGNINGTGNAANNAMIGTSGDNILNGMGGADVMAGGLGSDTYYVDNAGDQVIEAANGGVDYVHSTISYTLPTNVEHLILEGPGNINGTGNAANNAMIGTSGDNILNGMGGADVMAGGRGNDTYYVDNVYDRVIEPANAGTDTIHASISYTLPDNVENLILDGTGAINANGNALDNVITGNAGNNLLHGGAGSDTLTGNGGIDTFVYLAASESTVAASDYITDFVSGSDKIDLSALHLTSASGLSITTSGNYTYLTVDVDSDGIADMAIKFAGANAISSSDVVTGIATSAGAHPHAYVYAAETIASAHAVLAATLHAAHADHAY